jgi:hypothetical protein
MPDTLEFDQAKFADGQAAFARGIGLDALVTHMNVLGKVARPQPDSSEETFKRWRDETDRRERECTGFILGFMNGALQAIRRVDQQLMLPHADHVGGPQ